MNKKGFTLIELIVYTTAFILATLIITLFVFNLIKAQTSIRVGKEVFDNSQRAMEIMLWEIKHAKSVYLSTSQLGSHPGQLSLETEYNTPIGEKATYLDFYLDNDRLCLKKEGASSTPLISEKVKINNLIFNYLTASSTRSIRIELSAIYNDPTGKISYQATTTLVASAELRND